MIFSTHVDDYLKESLLMVLTYISCSVVQHAAALCFKTSNAVILRGGKEAIHSNLAIASAMQKGGEAKGMPENCIQCLAFR